MLCFYRSLHISQSQYRNRSETVAYMLTNVNNIDTIFCKKNIQRSIQNVDCYYSAALSPERQFDVVSGASGLPQMLIKAADAVEEVLLDGKDITSHHRGPDGVRLTDDVRVNRRQTPREHARSLLINARLHTSYIRCHKKYIRPSTYCHGFNSQRLELRRGAFTLSGGS